MEGWAHKEFRTLELNHQARKKRAIAVLDALSYVGESTPDAIRTKAALKGAYRLMDNDAVCWEALLEPHHRETIGRTTQHERVYLVQDTSEIDVTKPKRQVQGAGPLETHARRGFYLHPLLALTASGVPLGVAASHCWARDEVDRQSTPEEKKKRRNATPIEDKESYRWVQMIRRGKEIAAEHPGTQYVGVSDSESDIYEVFAELTERPANYDLLVRACQNRAVTDWEVVGAEDAEGSFRTLGDVLRAAPVRYQTQVQVRAHEPKTQAEKRARRQPRQDRTATLEVRAVTVTLRPPARSDRKLPPVRVNIVEAREIDPPEGEPPVVWTIITTLPIASLEEVAAVLQAYEYRWQIEVYFRTLKSGLGLEKLKYRTLDRYLNAMAFLMIVAWRVHMLTHAARQESQHSCEDYFHEDEWKAVCLTRQPDAALPETPPTIGEFLVMVACLGGYIDRKRQGPPGVHTVWRGMRRLEMLTAAYRAFGPGSKRRSGV